MQTAATARGEATRLRLLEAAATEFARHGIAGARVDRIVATAGSNKAQLYQYFGGKDRLFDAALDWQIDRLLEEVPFDGADLAAYAVAIYDITLERPQLVRLAAWLRLERRPDGLLFPGGTHAGHCASIAASQAEGQLDSSLDPADIKNMLTALALSWAPNSLEIAARPDDPDGLHRRRRTALADVVHKAFGPT